MGGKEKSNWSWVLPILFPWSSPSPCYLLLPGYYHLFRLVHTSSTPPQWSWWWGWWWCCWLWSWSWWWRHTSCVMINWGLCFLCSKVCSSKAVFLFIVFKTLDNTWVVGGAKTLLVVWNELLQNKTGRYRQRETKTRQLPEDQQISLLCSYSFVLEQISWVGQ